LTHTSPRNLDLGQVGQYIQAISMAGGLQMDMPTQRFLRSLVPGMPTEPEVIPTLAADQQPPPTTGESQAEEGGGDGNGQKPEAGGEDQHVSPPGGAGAGGRGSGSGSGGAEHFQGKPDPDDRAQIYTELVDAHSAAQRQILENWTGSLAGQVSELPDDATEGQVRDLLDDVILTGLLLMRERSVLDIAVAFWLGFGAPSGGPQTLAVLQSEVANNDSWLGYDNGQLRYTNPLGKPSLWGDIAGQLEGQIAAILLLLKEGRRDDVLVQIQDAVRGVTQGYHRAELYGGAVWHAIWAGVGEQERVQWEEYGRPPGPVRWVMNPFAIHCVTCLEFGDDPPGREYVSWFDMTQVTGGILPGVGTVCDGRCRCHLEAFVEGRGWCWL
jgi:hypothetical protein